MSPKRINLALQGGGAHGAFTWGVLDRLLEESEIEVAAITGTSAGAMNGAAFKSGWISGERPGAKDKLDWLWEQMGATQDPRLPAWMVGSGAMAGQMAHWLELSPPFLAAEAMSHMVSPYAYGPFYSNPLARVAREFEYDKVCASADPKLFVGATNVHTGKIRIFEGSDINTDSLLASACLPTMFQAVEIDGAHYWDGGYAGNPALFPLFKPDLPPDIVVVNINPLHRPEVPKSPQDIQNRINEVSFNSSLMRELRAIAFVQRLLDEGRVTEGAMKRLYVHMIADDEVMRSMSVATKLVPTPITLSRLKDAGRKAADRFLDAHFDDLGVQNSADLSDTYG
jgi:NTE family protein